MGKVILGMTLSPDGYINHREDSVQALYSELTDWRETGLRKESIENTGAVVMGCNSDAMSENPDWFAGNYAYQVPIFVLTHESPQTHPRETDDLTFTFITDGIESAVRQAEAAADHSNVNVIDAASTAQQCFKARLVDELHVDIVPVFIGGGLRRSDGPGDELPILERFQVMELPAAELT